MIYKKEKIIIFGNNLKQNKASPILKLKPVNVKKINNL